MSRVGETLEVAERTRQEEGKERESNIEHRQFLAEFKKTNKMVKCIFVISSLLHLLTPLTPVNAS